MSGIIRIAILANGKQARAEMERTGLAGSEMGKSVSRAAKAMGLAFAGFEAAHLAGEMIKSAGEFQKATTLLVTAGGEARANLGLVSDGILKVSSATGTSANDLAAGMYLIEKAGIRGADGLTVLKNAAEGAKAENVDMATEAQAVTSIMTSYHNKAAESASVVNELVTASGAAKTTMQEFAGSLAAVLPSASAAGLSFAQVGGAIATLTQHGTSAKEATQHLAFAIRSLQAPNNVASQEMQQLGINVTDLSKNLGKRGLTGTLSLVEEAIAKNMGKSGLVMLSAFKKSQSAGLDLQIMLKKMPADLAALSHQFLTGAIGAKEYQQGFKSMGADGNAMGAQFLSLTKTSKGFNNLLKSGNPSAQTYADALKKVMGGAVGMNVALQLSGENMAGFRTRVEEVNKAAADKSGVSTWAQTAQTFDVQASRLKESFKNLGISLALPALPFLTKGFSDLAGGASRAAPEIQSLFSTLKPLGDVLKVAANGLDAIPGPLKSLGAEAILAALVFPRLANGVTLATEAVVTQITSLRVLALELRSTGIAAQTSTVAMGRLGSAARLAAGAGGMLLFAQGMKQANTEGKQFVHTSEKIAGGALVGLSMGGPVGAAVGAVAGLASSFHDLQGAFDKMLGNDKAGTIGHLISEGGDAAAKASMAMNGYRQSLLTLQATIDTIAGKKTPDTRVAALASFKSNYSAIFAQLKAAGVTDRALAFAVTGNKKATAMILKTLASKDGLPGVKASTQFAQVASAINDITLRTGVAIRKTKDQISVTRNLTGLYKAFPAKTVSEIKINGIVPTLAGVKKVAEQYHVIGGRKLTALIKASGWEPTKKQVETLTRSLHNVDKVKPNVSPFLASLSTGIRNGQPKTATSLSAMLNGASRGAQGHARGGGANVGLNMALGLGGGILSGTSFVNSAANQIVAGALAQMRAAAKVKSPSRESMTIGSFLGQGLALGIDSTHATLRTAGENATRQALAGMQTPALDLHRRRLKSQAVSRQQVGTKQPLTFVLEDGTPLRGYIHGHARAAARDEIEQDNAFWVGR